MTKEDQNVLGLPAVTPDFGFSIAGSTFPIGGDHSFNTDRRRIQKEMGTQLVAIDAYTVKAVVGTERMAEMQVHASVKFQETCTALEHVKQQSLGTEYQAYVDEFNRRLVAVSAQQLLGSVKVGGAAIAREIARSPYPPEPEPERRTRLGRLLLG